MHNGAGVKLVVAILLLVTVALGAKVAANKLAPEGVASAATSLTQPGRAKTEAGSVRSVRFSGPGLRASYLPEVVGTREGEPLDAAELHSDRLRIVAALVARGHLDAAAGEPNVQWSSDGGAHVEFPVVAGPAYVVRSVRVEGKQLRRQRALATVPTLDAGQQVNPERIDANVTLIRDWLGHRGVRAEVTARLEVDRFTAQVDVVFTAN